ncbi:MAG: Uma2 family endonuclease [Isosphaeraceae bacterium]
MATAAPPKLMTAEEFMAANLGDGKFELVKGEVIDVPPAMPLHGLICATIAYLLIDYGRRSGIGYVLTNDSAVVTERDPDTVRGADLSFYREDRWPRSQVGTSLPPVPPTLVVEVYSPGNRRGQVLQELGEYLQVGVPLVWIVYPKNRKVAMYRAVDEPPVVLQESDRIEGLPELPGFSCPVADFFG